MNTSRVVKKTNKKKQMSNNTIRKEICTFLMFIEENLDQLPDEEKDHHTFYHTLGTEEDN